MTNTISEQRFEFAAVTGLKTVELVADTVLREPEVPYPPEVIWICMRNLDHRVVCSQSSENLLAD